jgi:hypothetical protein
MNIALLRPSTCNRHCYWVPLQQFTALFIDALQDVTLGTVEHVSEWDPRMIWNRISTRDLFVVLQFLDIY